MSLEQRMKDNEKELCRIKAEMKTQLSQADQTPQVTLSPLLSQVIVSAPADLVMSLVSAS